MSNEDTFFGGGKPNPWIPRPTPGGRREPSLNPQPRPTQVPGPDGLPSIGGVQASDRNPLLSAATPLLSLATELRNSASHPDPDGLFAHISSEINNFEAASRHAGATPESILASRYILCTFLDEIVLSTPWGHQSCWASKSLLNAFHNEGWGGEKFYLILDRLVQEPAKNIDLLELMYTVLALGFEGKLRVQNGGVAEIERIQNNLFSVIRSCRGNHESDLSPRWQGEQDTRTSMTRYVPVWVVFAVCLGIIALSYFGFLTALNKKSDPVAVEIAAIGRNLAPLVDREVYVQPQQITLQDLLEPEIRAGQLEVRTTAGAATVILKGDGLFASGDAAVRQSQIPVLQAVASALGQIPGQVLITGHTDDVPIRSIRYPSNWHLSKERAESVRDILATSVDPGRLIAEPRSSNEPLVDNDSAANRALNRRVEVTLYASPGRQ